jgi:pimeloyl-ACP methyl ester carboxylesterase
VVIAGGALFGAFDDEAPREVRRVEPLPGSRPPHTLADLFGQDAGLTDQRAHSHVRIVQVPQPDGSSVWIAQIPGTQEWDPHAGANPFDLTGNLHLMGGDTTTAMRSVRRSLEAAMADAGVPPGQPVMLSGHSQGGIIAAALAASPSFRRRFHVTRLVTSGAPIARFAIPSSVRVLSLEHEQDIVPRLEGESNPDRPTWVTVRRDVSGEVRDPITAHDRMLYAETARAAEASDDPSLVSWRRGDDVFFREGGQLREYAVGRATGQLSPAGAGSGSASVSGPPAPGTPAPTDSSSSSASASRSVAAPLN